jgi:dihydrofolate reductase
MKAIVCLDNKFGIGKNNTLPWPKNKEDLRFFREYTWGHRILMGRPTFAGMGLMFLENRQIYVLTRGPVTRASWVTTINDHVSSGCYINESAISHDMIVCGGRMIYDMLVPKCTELMVTHLNDSFDCDTYFPYSQVGIDRLFPKMEIVKQIDGGIIKRYSRDA